MIAQTPIRLQSTIQPHAGGKPYDWGEKGVSSYIAKLLNITSAPPDQSFAELWMGAHPEGESTVQIEGEEQPLSQIIAQYPVEILGTRVATEYQNKLPYLLKVLSAADILSIQVHPNKKQAVALRQADPAHYPDANHKPEMAIVLDELSFLAGLKSNAEIASLRTRYPELLILLDQKVFDRGSAQAFVALIEQGVANPDLATSVISQIVAKLKLATTTSAQEDIFLQLFQTTPNDIGLLTVFFLNHYLLTQNQAIFTPPGMPHAYVKGNIIECMANSDMVIRVGPTSKFRDTQALRDVVTDAQPLIYSVENGHHTYTTPASEFRLSKYELQANEVITNKGDCARIIFVVSGQVSIGGESISSQYTKGSSALLPAILPEVVIKCHQKAKLFIVDTPD